MSNNAVQEIRELLQHGMGSDSENRRMAEERLLKAEKEHTGTYLETLLTLVYECNNENTSISHFAGILFKKTVSSFWMSGSINESVKHGIRTSLVDRLPTLPPNAPINQLSEALSQMCVSEVIHGSNLPPFPENSNIPYCCITLDLVVQTLNRVAEEGEDTQRFASFLSQFSGTNGFVLMMLQYARVLLLPLHLAIKYLFENHKNTLLSNVSGDALKELINLVCEKWMFAMIILTDILEDDDITYDDPQEEREEQELITRLSEVCSVSMRLLRRIIGLGFTLSEKSKHSTEEISDELHKAMTQYADLQQALFDGRNNPRSTINNGYMKHVLEKQIINATKAVKELVGRFPLSMNVYLPSILKFYLPKILSSPSVNQLPEESFERKFLVYALHCFTESFESSSIYEQIQNTLEIVFEGIDNMKQLLFVILTRFLPLNQQELELCESDPQEYIQEQLLESYQYDIKASAKFLWLSMIRNCKQLPTIALEMISQFLQAPCDPNDMREFLLRREACYHALSLCYNEFSPLISFSSFFSSMILPDANRKEREYRLIKRQIANLFVEDWSRDLGDQLPTALQMLVSFQKEDDYIVSIWASIAFRNICNGYILQNLDPQQFQGFATEALNAMITLTLKLKVDSVAEIVVENIGRMCLVMGGKLLANGVGLKVIEGLLGLWQQAGSSMLKNTIIRCMSSAVHSGVTNIPDNPQTELQVEEHITKLILVSTNINSDRNMIHTAEGISLWKNMIERNENGKDKCWLINRYPSSLKERLKQLLNIPNEIPHLNPPSFISLLQHHTILIPAFFTSCKSEITLIIGNILSSPKKISWKVCKTKYHYNMYNSFLIKKKK